MRNEPLIRFANAGDITVKAGHRLGPRFIYDCELVYFPVGNQTVYEIDGTAYVLDEPCALLTRPKETHMYRFDPAVSTRHLFVHFDMAGQPLSDRYPRLLQGEPAIIKLGSQSLIPPIMKQLFYYFHKRPFRWKPLSEMLLLSMLEELESRIGSEPPDAVDLQLPPQIYSAMKYMELNLTGKMEIEHVARYVGWSHEHFSRIFQQHVGQSPKEWVTKRRIERAAQLLLQRTGSVKSIARDIGFVDEYYFHRLFRRWMGMTATEYRRKYGESRFHELAPPDDLGRFYPLNYFFRLDGDTDT